MGRKPEKKPSFFKFLLTEDFDTQLRLPGLFVKRYGHILPENVYLKISSGETWAVRLEKLDDDDHYFTQGWNEFAKDLKLIRYEFIFFWYNQKKCTFDVISYGLHGCNNQPLVSNPVDEANPLFFEMLLKHHQRSRVTLPRRFFKASGLINKETVKLEYLPTHCTKVVKLDHRSHARSDLALGWGPFRRQNSIDNGKIYSFEFIPSKSVIQVKEVTVHINGNGVGEKRSRSPVIEEETAAWSDEEEEETKPDIKNNERSKSEEGSELYFEIHLKKYQRFRLALPYDFVVATGLSEEDPVVLEYLPTHGRQEVRLYRGDRLKMTKGWRDFQKANGICVGNCYSFKFNPDKNVIQVNELKVHNETGSDNKRTQSHVLKYDSESIDEETDTSPNASDDDSDEEMSYTEDELSADEAVGSDVLEYVPISSDEENGTSPNDSDEEEGSRVYFDVILNKYHKSTMTVPRDFLRAAGLMEEETVKLEYLPAHRFQKVTLDHTKPYQSEMAAGWPKFRETNRLIPGKTYSFEFNPIKNVIQVEEVKKVHNDSGPSRKRSRTRDEEGEDMPNPTFEITLKEHQRSRLCVPKHFLEATGLNNKTKVALEYRGGPRLNVALVRRWFSRTFIIEMSSGWGQFRKENNLKFRKTYLFEYVRSKDVIRIRETNKKK